MRPTKQPQGIPKYPPLADLLRPTKLDDILGQEHLIGPGMPFRRMVEKNKPISTILWGPPGTGKTTIVKALSNEIDTDYYELNATDTSTKEIRSVIDQAAKNQEKQTILFIDEIHRLAKNIKDIFLPCVENGTVRLFGATTENPKFSVNSTILSRSLIFETKPLKPSNLATLYLKIVKHYSLLDVRVKTTKEVLQVLINRCSGDARKFITSVEALVEMMSDNGAFSMDDLESVMPCKHVVFDKSGNEHFSYAHCYQDAIQDSDENGAIYWLATWLNSGEDPAYICRRMLITAFEDCSGNPFAIASAMAACYTTERTGMPECMIAMAHATIEMAKSKRNKSAFYAIHAAMADVQNGRTIYVPPDMRAGTNAYRRIIKKQYVKNFEKDVLNFNDLSDTNDMENAD